jgi:hypothetical protein
MYWKKHIPEDYID